MDRQHTAAQTPITQNNREPSPSYQVAAITSSHVFAAGGTYSNEGMDQVGGGGSIRIPEEIHVVPTRFSNITTVESATSGPLFPGHRPTRGASGLDRIVPGPGYLPPRPKTIGERLQPTLDTAYEAKARYASKARLTGLYLNIAIGLQVLLSSLITGLSTVLSGKEESIMTAILGGLSTVIAAYLARARGSQEPELSLTRTKDLEHFIGDCLAFQMDFGHDRGNDHDDRLNGFRMRFKEILGNANRYTANGRTCDCQLRETGATYVRRSWPPGV